MHRPYFLSPRQLLMLIHLLVPPESKLLVRRRLQFVSGKPRFVAWE
jgi:hypothetical protein